MELDELKSIWKKNEPGFQLKEEAEIAAMLKGSSKSVIAKLKRSVWFELIFTLVAGIALLIYALTLPSGAMKWTCTSILVILVAYPFYYIKKIILLNRFDATAENIRANLEHLIKKLSSFLQFYKRSYTILYPVYFVLGLLFAAMERGTEDFLSAMSRPKTIALLSITAVFYYFLSTKVVDWLLKKLYGNHLEKLKSILSDLKG